MTSFPSNLTPSENQIENPYLESNTPLLARVTSLTDQSDSPYVAFIAPFAVTIASCVCSRYIPVTVSSIMFPRISISLDEITPIPSATWKKLLLCIMLFLPVKILIATVALLKLFSKITTYQLSCISIPILMIFIKSLFSIRV